MRLVTNSNSNALLLLSFQTFVDETFEIHFVGAVKQLLTGRFIVHRSFIQIPALANSWNSGGVKIFNHFFSLDK